MDNMLQLADTLSKSAIVQNLGGGKFSREDLFVVLMMADRLGIDPMAALTGVYVVKGRPYIGARLVRGLVLKNGHVFDVVEWTAESCTVLAARRGQEPRKYSYTIREAQHAGLTAKETWRLHPRRMLLNAVTRHVMDACFADLFLGLTTDDDSDPTPAPAPARAHAAETTQLKLSDLIGGNNDSAE